MLLPHSRSGLWSHFSKLSPKLAKCLHDKCQKEIKTTGGNTSGLTSHLKNHHKIDLKARSLRPTADQIKIQTFTQFMPFQEDFETDIAKFVAVELIPPFKLYYSETFQSWAFKAWKKQIPSPPTIWNIIQNTADFMKEKISQYFQNSATHYSFCCDEWCSKNGRRFMNINYHAINFSLSLGLARIDTTANAENLGDIFLNHLKSFVTQKPSAVTRDWQQL